MSHLLKSVEDGVMKIVLNRPEAMNALSRDMMMGLTDALNEAASSRDIGCVVVRGAGDKAFCAGGDVKSMAAGRDQDKTYEDKGEGLVLLTLNRPEVANAMNTQMGHDLLGFFDTVNADPLAHRCIVMGGPATRRSAPAAI